MSKRFGRNQRRKMLALVEQQRGWLSEKHDLIKQQRDRADRLRDRLDRWADTVLHLAGDNSAFNETVRSMDWDLERQGERICLKPVTNMAYGFTRFDDIQPATMVALEALIITLETKFDLVRQQILITLRPPYPVKAAYYAMDRRLLERMPPSVVRDMAGKIACDLARIIGKSA